MDCEQGRVGPGLRSGCEPPLFAGAYQNADKNGLGLVPLSAVYFGAWNDTYDYPTGWSFYTKFPHRWSSLYNNGHFKGTGIDSVAIMEAENAAASDAKITAWAFDFYLPAAITHASDPDEKHEFLNAPLEAFLVSSNKSSMKFWVTMIGDSRFGMTYPAGDPFKYFTAFSNYVANLMADPQYLKIDGKPVIGLFGIGGGAAGPTITVTDWQNFLAPMGGQAGVFAIEMTGTDSRAVTYGMQASFKYGVQNLPGGLGHQPFSLSMAQDMARWTPAAGLLKIAQITPANDGRALDTVVTTRTFVDQPSQPQWLEFLVNGLGLSGSKHAMTFWNESAEEGAAVHPTAQEGSRFLKGIKWARTGQYDSTCTYPVNAYNADTEIVASSGTWTYVGPLPTGVVGAHDRDQVISANVGDYKELIHARLIACDVYAETGPDCGIVEIYKDGVLDQTIDCYTAGQATSVKIATVTFTGPVTDHRVKALVKGTKNGASSSVQIKLDYFNPTFVP